MDATSRYHQAVLNVDVFILEVQHVQKSHQVKFWGGMKVCNDNKKMQAERVNLVLTPGSTEQGKILSAQNGCFKFPKYIRRRKDPNIQIQNDNNVFCI